MASTNRKVIDSYFASLDAEDWDTLETLFASHAVLEGTGVGRREGIEDLVRFYKRVFVKFPTHHDAPRTFIEEGDRIAVVIDFEGATAEGRPCTFSAVDVFELSDGVITRLDQWYDTAEIARQVAG